MIDRHRLTVSKRFNRMTYTATIRHKSPPDIEPLRGAIRGRDANTDTRQRRSQGDLLFGALQHQPADSPPAILVADFDVLDQRDLPITKRRITAMPANRND